MIKILVVDDSEFFRKIYSEALTQAGFEVVLAVNGQEAIDKLRSENPRLVLMDLVMPVLTGAEALAEMKKDPAIKTTPVVMLTSVSADIKGDDLLLLGAVGYLVKDKVTPQEVVDKIKEMLGTSTAALDPTLA